MTELLLDNEPVVRLVAFGLIFVVMALWESLAPRRGMNPSRLRRWPANIGIVILNTVVVRLIFPVAGVGVALLSAERGWGVLNLVELPGWLTIVLAFIALDLIIYLQHVMVHALPMLWRLHRVHHADPFFDLTTGARFHPLEIVLSMGIKIAAIVLLGPPVIAVVIFEVLLNASSMFNHANARISIGVDRWLRWIVVTPDMHRVHHSIHDHETNSNFGFCLPWWDRLLGTYLDQPHDGHDAMRIGIDGFDDPQQTTRLRGMLWLPFVARDGGYAINRRSWGGGKREQK